MQAATEPGLKPRGHWDRLAVCCNFVKSHSHAAMAEAVGRRSLTRAGHFRFQACPFEIFGGQTGTGTRFSPSNYSDTLANEDNSFRNHIR